MAAEDSVEVFNKHRALLFSIAYRMLGSAADAEDILQEAFLRWQRANEEEVRSPRSYLSAVVTRLCIDQLRSAKARREVYVGPWLPEPIMTQHMPDMTGTQELAESLSIAFLVVLESLSPVERAVFLLREVFGYDYAEIARIVGKSEANCRQITHRAQQRIHERRPRFHATHEQQERVTQEFMRACANGNLHGLMALLTNNAVLMSDGGGKAQAARNPIYGPNNIARFILGILAKSPPNVSIRLDEVNGQPGIVTSLAGETIAVLVLDVQDEQIRGVHIVANPDKLQALS
ncbi:MAG TPA: RNA polymerase sigma-70 factor [Chloroflexia bacterium]|nr:RNA polymerase sigma-70 factor [Chloroflexia bacterium]